MSQPNLHLQEILSTPHQLYVADVLLKADVGPFVSSLSFGHVTPAGITSVVFTMKVATDQLAQIVSELNEALAKGKKSFPDAYKNIIEKI